MATTSHASERNRSRGGAGLRRRFARLAAASGLFAVVVTLSVIAPPAAHAATGVLAVSVTSDGSGYAAVSSSGEVHGYRNGNCGTFAEKVMACLAGFLIRSTATATATVCGCGDWRATRRASGGERGFKTHAAEMSTSET